MKVCCLADIHGHLPDVPDCDLLILAGDYCPMPSVRKQARWLRHKFGPWLESLKSRMAVVGVAGNHDFIFQREPGAVPTLPWVYLQDSGAEILGKKFWGSPWQPVYGYFAFNAVETDLALKWDLIPDDTDVLVLHGPPYGYGDFSVYDKIHTGSASLRRRIEAVRPGLVVAGHIHSGHGIYEMAAGETVFVNASYVDEDYQPFYPIETVDID